MGLRGTRQDGLVRRDEEIVGKAEEYFDHNLVRAQRRALILMRRLRSAGEEASLVRLASIHPVRCAHIQAWSDDFRESFLDDG